jgi:hypothetical protein
MDLCNSKDEAGLESHGVGVMYIDVLAGRNKNIMEKR